MVLEEMLNAELDEKGVDKRTLHKKLDKPCPSFPLRRKPARIGEWVVGSGLQVVRF